MWSRGQYTLARVLLVEQKARWQLTHTLGPPFQEGCNLVHTTAMYDSYKNIAERGIIYK